MTERYIRDNDAFDETYKKTTVSGLALIQLEMSFDGYLEGSFYALIIYR